MANCEHMTLFLLLRNIQCGLRDTAKVNLKQENLTAQTAIILDASSLQFSLIPFKVNMHTLLLNTFYSLFLVLLSPQTLCYQTKVV